MNISANLKYVNPKHSDKNSYGNNVPEQSDLYLHLLLAVLTTYTGETNETGRKLVENGRYYCVQTFTVKTEKNFF